MGLRFRKSIRLGAGIRLNLAASRRGVSTGVSGGMRGARVSLNSRGEEQTTLSLPGTGLSWVNRRKISRLLRGSGRAGWIAAAGLAAIAVLLFLH
jgi:hypothetical protein